jgi:aquaporin Z
MDNLQLLLLLSAIGTAASCSEFGGCINEAAFDEVNEVSLLQTDVRLSKQPPSIQIQSVASKTSEQVVHKVIPNDEVAHMPSSGIDAKVDGTHIPSALIAKEAASSGHPKAAKAPKVAKAADTKGEGAVSWQFDLMWTVVALLLLGAAHIISNTKSSSKGLHDPIQRPRYVAEFVGTFMLLVSIGCNVIVGDKTWGITSIACTLTVMIYALGGISGGHFNPAVSVALALSRKMPWVEAATYICVQLSAALFAGDLYGYMLKDTFNLAPKAGYNLLQAGLVELLYTFMLTFVVLNVATAKKVVAGNPQYYGIAIGFTVIAGGYGGGSISGGCFNPAVALGIDAASSKLGFGLCIVYIVFELIGCALAAFFFRIVSPADFLDDKDDEIRPTSLSQKLSSEFLGTYMLVLTVGLNVLTKSPAAVFSIAASLMSMVFALGHVSGAHFNPAVTIAIMCRRDCISIFDALMYMIVQVIAGVFASLTFMFLMNGQTVPLKPGEAAFGYQALLGEFLFTFLLCFVVLSVATVRKSLTEYFGFAIGACVIAGGLAIGSLSGGSLNPAVSSGLAVSDSFNSGNLGHLMSYCAAEFSGAIIASSVFMVTHAQSEFTSVKA